MGLFNKQVNIVVDGKIIYTFRISLFERFGIYFKLLWTWEDVKRKLTADENTRILIREWIENEMTSSEQNPQKYRALLLCYLTHLIIIGFS